MIRASLMTTLLLLGCGGEFHTPGQEASVRLAAHSALVSSDGHTLVVTKTKVVIDSLLLTQTDGTKVKVPGPFLVAPIPDGASGTVMAAAIPHGSYVSIDVAVRPLSSADDTDVQAAKAAGFDELLAANGALEVSGLFDGQEFTSRQAAMSTETVLLQRPWNVRLGATANVTMVTRFDQWFARGATGMLQDPRFDDADDDIEGFTMNLTGAVDDDDDGMPDH